MKEVMKIRIAISMLTLTMGSISHGQAIPAGGASLSTNSSGPNLPTLDGIVHYALTASEVAQLGYFGPGETSYSTALSGDLAYTAKSTVLPFSMTLTGGVILPDQSTQGTSYFTNAVISQGLVTRHWNLNIADTLSFLPQSPTTGLSGIPGVGDLGALPLPGPVLGPAGGILSAAGNRVANSLNGSVERQINHNTSISGSGVWSVLHFLDYNGFDNTNITGSVALNRRLDARSSASVDAVYSTFSFGANSGYPDIETRGINLSYQRVLTRAFSISLSGGPQLISSSNGTLIPKSTNAAAFASLSYALRLTTATVVYTHGANGGSGVLPGAESDSINASVGHTYGRKWVASLTLGYSRSAGLTQVVTGSPTIPANVVYNTIFGGAQLTRAINAHFSGYASYTGQSQSNNSALGVQNALSGTSHTFGIGITYTPRSTRLGQF
jgi:hypothetical protein